MELRRGSLYDPWGDAVRCDFRLLALARRTAGYHPSPSGAKAQVLTSSNVAAEAATHKTWDFFRRLFNFHRKVSHLRRLAFCCSVPNASALGYDLSHLRHLISTVLRLGSNNKLCSEAQAPDGRKIVAQSVRTGDSGNENCKRRRCDTLFAWLFGRVSGRKCCRPTALENFRVSLPHFYADCINETASSRIRRRSSFPVPRCGNSVVRTN